MKAVLTRGSETVTTTAKKRGGVWFIGGDCLSASTDAGWKVFILSKGKIYFLRGAFMIFQDYDDGTFGERGV